LSRDDFMKDLLNAKRMMEFLILEDYSIDIEGLQRINRLFKRKIPRFVEYNPIKYSFATLVVRCAACDNKTTIIFNEFKHNKSQRVFCNNSCRAEGIKGKNHPRYNPATRRVYKSNNNVWIKYPDHPFADSRGGIYEHRFIMENHLWKHYPNSKFLISVGGT